MLHVKNLDEGLEVFKALGSELRINIIKLLQENHEMNMNELATSLGITNGALTSHIKKLEESGIIQVMTERGGHGNQKICKVAVDKIVVDVESEETEEDQNIYNTEVKVGHYSDYNVYPTCGLATSKAIVGEVDDPRYFSHPDRINAGILWFTKGYIEYMIPNLLPSATKIDQITVSLEISSEAPGINNDWPSDISIFLNDVKIGTWTSPGDYGDVQGIFTPDWWFPNWNQYGLLKMIVINKKGTFVDGLKISDVTINQFNLDYKSTVRFKFEIEEDAKNIGGITIFGSEFGNYNQDIKVRIAYSPMEIAKK
ncbi:ArsR family transcriptional regulator [Blautia stercoris]|uniref:Winged helix-turn-helix transcriptional regulator n=1 Tax=Blautia stercoris TaxID=871664 RepID=A0ABR7PDC9_9FIRM|nr:winged helix-turn-helix transcriptional regulator [Blautia stercoris]MBC8629429.1 winged helix-turn-helix transcriptional regulator [Blautia stercoris]RGF20697.1 winged helix-turn-helix transcriptional regulator [Firmicutes bacterium AM10-47]RHV41313.1 winged helix-turn-helix transcriptional regulator [Firmicutes bacterium OM04-13BH]